MGRSWGDRFLPITHHWQVFNLSTALRVVHVFNPQQPGQPSTRQPYAYILLYHPLIRSRSSTFCQFGPKAWSHMCGRA